MLTALVAIFFITSLNSNVDCFADTIKVVPKIGIVHNNDTLIIGMTNLQFFLQKHSIERHTLPKIQSSWWEGTLISSTGEPPRPIGGRSYLQMVEYKKLQLSFRGQRLDSLMLNSININFDSIRYNQSPDIVLYFADQVMNINKANKFLKSQLTDSPLDGFILEKDKRIYYFNNLGFRFQLAKSRIEEILIIPSRN